MSSGRERVVLQRAQADKLRANFIVGEALKVIPARRSAKLVVFAWLSARFEAARRYSESEVNTALARAHADVATLRRGMYDEFFLDRADGYYWRTPDRQNLVIVDAPATGETGAEPLGAVTS